MSEESKVDTSLFPDAQASAEANSVWGAGQDEASKDNPLGTFNARIKTATLGRSQSSDRLQITYELEILNGPAAGSTIRKYDGLDKPVSAKITQQQLARLGVDIKAIKSVEQVPAVLLSLEGKTVVILCKQSGQFYNIHFQRLVDPNAAVGAVGAAKPGLSTPAPRAGGKF